MASHLEKRGPTGKALGGWWPPWGRRAVGPSHSLPLGVMALRGEPAGRGHLGSCSGGNCWTFSWEQGGGRPVGLERGLEAGVSTAWQRAEGLGFLEARSPGVGSVGAEGTCSASWSLACPFPEVGVGQPSYLWQASGSGSLQGPEGPPTVSSAPRLCFRSFW